MIYTAETRAYQRVFPLRCGTFLIFRAAEAPAERFDLDGSLGFPANYASEVDPNETWFF
jgi:hypothetical protein